MKRIFWVGFLIYSFNSHALFDDEEAREKINDLQSQLNSLRTEKIDSIEDQIKNLQQILEGGSLLEFNNKINETLQDLSKLRGDIEVLQFNLQNIEERQKINYQEIESRFQALEEIIEVLTADSEKKETPSAEVSQEKNLDLEDKSDSSQQTFTEVQNDINQELTIPSQEITSSDKDITNKPIDEELPPLIDDEQEANMFKDGEGLMRSTKYKESFELFDRFVSAYPNSLRLVEAKKNIGYIQFALKNYQASLSTYDKLIEEYPDHSLMPEILFGKANTEIQLTRITKAKQTLRKIIKEFPNAKNLESAKKRLQALESIKL